MWCFWVSEAQRLHVFTEIGVPKLSVAPWKEKCKRNWKEQMMRKALQAQSYVPWQMMYTMQRCNDHSPEDSSQLLPHDSWTLSLGQVTRDRYFHPYIVIRSCC